MDQGVRRLVLVSARVWAETGEDNDAGQAHDLSGPVALTWGEAVAEIARAAKRPIAYTSVHFDAYAAELAERGYPAEYIEELGVQFEHVRLNRSAYLSDGVRQALGREPRDFRAYAEGLAAG